MTAPDFTYAIYLRADCEAVWHALFDRAMTALYWGHHNVSDWTDWAEWRQVRTDAQGTVDIEGRVIEHSPPERLTLTWRRGGRGEESRVTIALTPLGPDTRLDLTHSGLPDGAAERDGWPAVLSNLKTLIETGEVLREDDWPQP